MIKVDVLTNKDGFMNIQVYGHGESNVCASVSTLMQSQVRFLQELSKQYPGDLNVSVTDADNPEPDHYKGINLQDLFGKKDDNVPDHVKNYKKETIVYNKPVGTDDGIYFKEGKST